MQKLPPIYGVNWPIQFVPRSVRVKAWVPKNAKSKIHLFNNFTRLNTFKTVELKMTIKIKSIQYTIHNSNMHTFYTR